VTRPGRKPRSGLGLAAAGSCLAVAALGLGCGGDDISQAAPAQAQGGSNPVVAQGRSPAGVRWRIRAKRYRDYAIFDFSVGDGSDGYGSELKLPIPHSFIFTADTGSDVDPHHESDLSGITARRVSKLVLDMSKGHSIKVHPQVAPQIAPGFEWLNDFRFFDRFYLGHRYPVWVKALDARGHVLARKHTYRGIFPAGGSKDANELRGAGPRG
jgi:hypothetical protein